MSAPKLPRVDPLLIDRVAFELVPLLDAMGTLTDALRVLKRVDMIADYDKALGERLARACEDWRNPLHRDTTEIVSEAMSAICVLARDMVNYRERGES